MKTIVLATDFSKRAAPAAEFALRLAEQLSTRLVLLHVYHHPLRIGLLREVFTPMEEKNKVSARRKLYRLRDRLRQLARQPIELTVMAREGATLETIQTVVQEQKADLLVMGTAGERSVNVQYFGSQATEMILRTTVPLLLVPPTAHYAPFKHLVVALDLEKAIDARALDEALRLANRFKTFLTVVCVSDQPTSPAIEQAALRIRDLLKNQPHTLSIVRGHDLAQTILRFGQENDADLILMLAQPHNRFLYTFLESNTQALARQTEVPVLAIV